MQRQCRRQRGAPADAILVTQKCGFGDASEEGRRLGLHSLLHQVLGFCSPTLASRRALGTADLIVLAIEALAKEIERL